MAVPTIEWIKANLVSVKAYGAKGDGITDDRAAIQAAIDANPGKAIWFPDTCVYSYTGVINLVSAGLYSEGAILARVDELYGAINLSGTAPFVYGMVIFGNCTYRSNRDAAAGIAVNICTEFSVRYTTIYNTMVGIKMNPGCTNGYVARNTVLFTWADGIHHTTANGVSSPTGASNIITEYNYVYGSGDDCISVVSYANLVPPITGSPTSTPCDNIIIRYNRVGNNRGARGITVVGGTNITIFGNNIRNTPVAGIYIASEPSYYTLGVDTVNVTYNYLYNCGLSAIGHGAIHAYTSYNPVLNVTFNNNHIELPKGNYYGFFTTGSSQLTANFTNNTGRTSGTFAATANLNGSSVVTITPNTTWT